jgi:putative ABC transport system permease protein
MIKNYLRVALRNLWRHRGFSLLNVLGLTIGMSAFFLIFLYVCFELSYDSFHTKADRIYRVVSDVKTRTETQHFNSGPVPAVIHMAKEFPEVETTVRVNPGDNWMVIQGTKVFEQADVASADSTFFRVFDFPLLKGNPQTALRDPFNVVLTETTAKKFFGNIDPMGKSLTLTRDKFHGTVTGVMKDLPENSHLKISMMISLATVSQHLDSSYDQEWDNYGTGSYVVLKPGASAAALQAKLPAYLEKMNGAQMHKKQEIPTLLLEPIRDVYLYSTRDGSKTGNITNIYIFSIIGVFILLIACINFVNLTTARSAERAKEVGIRKVVGAGKGMLAGQFIGESIILCVIAYLLAVVLSALLLPGFNQLAGKVISTGVFSHPWYLVILLGFAILIGIVAGLYPALVLSSFQPVAVLKGRFSAGTRGLILRKSLVIVQFTIATGLMIGTLVVYNQLNFMRSQDLGFSKEQKLVLDTRNDSAKMAFKDEVSRIPGVLSAAISTSVPGDGSYFPNAYQLENVRGDMQAVNAAVYFVDYDYLSEMGMRIVAGRAFSRSFATDTAHSMVLNESAVRLLGYTSPEQVIGKRYDQFGTQGRIVGVVKDFHFRSLQEVIKPLSIRIEPRAGDLLCVKLDGHRIPATLSAIQEKWKVMLPSRPFTYFFLDELFDKQYRAEDRFGRLFLNFAVLAIFISCLGLMGLASYSTLQRTKEIGVRKVVGASVGNIVFLLSKDFLKLVCWAFLVAAPVSWFFVHGWLQGFAYRITAYWWIYAVAGLGAIFVALLTISFQSVRAALANPVKSLRAE